MAAESYVTGGDFSTRTKDVEKYDEIMLFVWKSTFR
jgi:hypothetical protein